MGFALESLEPLDRGGSLDVVVPLELVVYFTLIQTNNKLYKGYDLTPKYAEEDRPNES
ncbi:hypothetical protein [Halorubrum sp. GN11GM_10-3_MGM]|uniref:hypothetical protein n=1 Tax=Halorubrum sp. GN11GM_10-3_MGM TaxID=2518111 RepID=UPI0013053180|nr:hypothetical protein [Halorubrum sp. GN11GM_10-3_MGM]